MLPPYIDLSRPPPPSDFEKPSPHVLNTYGKPCCKQLFSKQTCLRVKKFVALIAKKKQLRMNGKEMTLIFFKLYMVYIKIRTTIFPYLLVNLFNERCISLAKGYKYLNKSISSYKNNGLTFLKKTMYMPTIPLLLQNIGKRRMHIAHYRTLNITYTCILSHTSVCLMFLKCSRKKLSFRNLMFVKVENM